MRFFRRKIGILFAAVSAAALCSCAPSAVSSQDFVFDTYSSVSVSGRDAEDALESVVSSFKELSGAFELCYGTEAAELPDNEAYRDCFDKTKALNEVYGDGVNVACGALTGLWGISTPNPRVPSGGEIADAMGKITCERYGDFPDGMKLDFGAVAKGYACDRAYELLKSTETEYAVASLSSTTLLYGEKPDGTDFKIGITDPLTGEGYVGIITTEAAFASTSGGYERYFEAQGKRYCHILDMNTGRPADTDLISVTVTVPADTLNGGIMSDFLATLIYIGGSGELNKWLDCGDIEVVAVREDGAVYSSCKGFELDEGGGYYYGE